MLLPRIATVNRNSLFSLDQSSFPSGGQAGSAVPRGRAGPPWAAAFFLWAGAAWVVAQLPAFPGAEGEGMYVTGGRGGDVYRVTNLNDSGPGSLRNGVINAPAGGRTIVFDVSGVIHLTSTLNFSRGNLTVAGQTAPGLGVCLRNYGASVSAQNVILRHLRFRPGDANKGPNPGFNGDSLSLGASRVMVDHCSASWGIDEVVSCAGTSPVDVTVQHCFIVEGLDQTGLYHGAWDTNYNPGGSGHHSMGSLIKPINGSGQAAFHHNLWAANGNRNPAVGTYYNTQTFRVDVRNNVIFNNRNNGYRSGGLSARLDMNYVGNYIIAGSATSSSWRTRAFNAGEEDANFYIFQSGNRIDGNLNRVRDGTDTGWAMFSGTYNALSSAIAMRPVATQTAEAAYYQVLNFGGALPWARDSVDARQLFNLRNLGGVVVNSQNEVGGYPAIPAEARPAGWDTDDDGLPDHWEVALGRNPKAANNNFVNPDGYTDLEHYHNWLAAPHLITPQGQPVDVDLRAFTNGVTSATCSVFGATNGFVALLPDGFTARFTPGEGFFGRSGFSFRVADGGGTALTNTVGVLVTPVAAPRFTRWTISGNQLVLGGAGGLPFGSFLLLTASNPAVPSGDWARASTNQFDASGGFQITNLPPPAASATFYRVLIP